MTTSATHPSRPGRGSGATNGVRPMVKRWWPLGPFVLAGLLVALATALDTGDSPQRDAALLIGSFALFVLVPLATLTAVTVLIVRHRMRGGRTLALIATLAIVVTTTTGPSVASAKVRTIDWSDPEVTVSYPGGWSAAVCGVDVPMVCINRNGVAAGLVEVGAAPLSAFDGYTYNPDRPRVFLKALADDFLADTIEQRRSVCDPDYEVHPMRTRNRIVLGRSGISFGFSGNFAGEATSELVVIHMVVVDDRVIFVNASAHDPTSCEAGEGTFTVDDLRRFRCHLEHMVRHLPTPEFLLSVPEIATSTP